MPVRKLALVSIYKPLITLVKTGSTILGTLCSHKSLFIGFSMSAGLWFGLFGTTVPVPMKSVSPFYSVMPLKTYLHLPSVIIKKPLHLQPGSPRLTTQQMGILKAAYHIGHKLGMGNRLAAVAFQESGLGLDPISPAHYGVGAVGYSALQQVLQSHPELQADFQGRNWADTLIQNPKLSLLVAAYYLKHCYHVAGDNWEGALNLYRYGYGQRGTYPSKIAYREQQLKPYFDKV